MSPPKLSKTTATLCHLCFRLSIETQCFKVDAVFCEAVVSSSQCRIALGLTQLGSLLASSLSPENEVDNRGETEDFYLHCGRLNGEADIQTLVSWQDAVRGAGAALGSVTALNPEQPSGCQLTYPVLWEAT